HMLEQTAEPGRLADRLTVWIDAPHELRVEILHELDVVARLRKVIELIGKARASAELRETIDSEVRRELGKSQKEVVLREQLKAIKKQLGESDEISSRCARSSSRRESRRSPASRSCASWRASRRWART